HDSKGETWIGTRGGLNLLARSKQVFHKFSAMPDDNNFLNSSIIYAIWIDNEGNIYVGTEDGGVNIYNPTTGKYNYLTAEGQSPFALSQNCIKAFLDDGKGNLWIGTFLGGIDILNLKTSHITNYSHDPGNNSSLSDNRVWDFTMDKSGQIWIATTKGVDRFDPKNNSFIHYPQIFGVEQVAWIDSDSDNNIWIGAIDEIIIYNQSSKQITRFKERSRSFFEDHKNRYWITTFDRGIAIYSKSEGPLKYYNEDDGLANNQSLCILEDNDYNLWISTNNGLSKFNPELESFQNFTYNDGLQNNQFCYLSSYKAKSGELLFGSISGFNVFNPEEIVPYNTNVPIVLTDLKIFNKSVEIGDDKKSVLTKSISETNELTLDFSQNVFTIEFAALNYVNSENNLYSYYLEGFDRDWNEPSNIRTATYTNLNPDEYILHIKLVNPGTPAESPELQLKINITPPFWKTTLFRILIILSIILLIYTLVKFIINREKIKNDLILERINARKLHELDMLKLRFFTNISHEIRTPLTLIIGPIEKMLTKKINPEEIPDHLKLVHRNAKQLDRLINQLLDFRKLESGNLKLNLTQSDIVSFVSEIVHSFDEFAKEKEITLSFNTLKKNLVTIFDPDKVEKILNNLLSNAFKFTGSGGKITVNLSLVFDSDDEDYEHSQAERQFIELTVKDTGQGIKSKNLDKIFNRFFQTGKENDNPGTGIGLALVKELVKLHKGDIFVTSKPGKGSKFTIRIPYETSLQEMQSTQTDDEESAVYEKDNSAQNENSDIFQSKIMLIVEDNPDVRFFIKSHFNGVYKILEAKNGQDGWEKALQIIPDVIISDIMMPDVDGYEFCKKIKKDERTSHIPILLITALHSKEHELKGLSYGADDYITKPFDIQVLQAKVENMLSIRESLKEKFTNTVILEPKNVVISSPDERFLQKVIEIVENNISDSELDIEQFALKVGVSRMQLYRKLHALTDMTVKEFIRHIRLKRATQLLVQKKMNISEIAFAVGFKDLSHFRKCFRREFGMSATEYINQHEDGN
ncbi:MAG: response regulator, partial [Prolixibacteraceae bacterium]|nr:response regulator [Prolixibacteraceae bacterium]